MIFMFYYTQSTFFDNLIFNETFDPVLQHWENLLFGFQDGGAFPGTHVTTSVIIFLYSFNEFKTKRRLILL